MLECLWASRRWGLDRRPDLEWRLIARYLRAHKQPKLYLDAVDGQAGAVSIVQPQAQGIDVRSSPLPCCARFHALHQHLEA
jgi:hypothetical protein